MSLIKVLTLLFDIDMNINTHYFLFYYLSRLIPKYFIGFEIFYSLDENPIRNYYIYDNISEKYIIS